MLISKIIKYVTIHIWEIGESFVLQRAFYVKEYILLNCTCLTT